MALNYYELTLKFKMTTLGQALDPGVATLLAKIMVDYSDGRLPFEAEMIYTGLERALKQAIWHYCQKQMQQEYGDEVVTSEDGNTAKWYLEAQKMMEAMSVPLLNYCSKISIERD